MWWVYFTALDRRILDQESLKLFNISIHMFFSVKACDGLCQLLKSTGSGWNTIKVSIDRVDLCQTHCKQVPDFSRAPGSNQTTWASFGQFKQANTRSLSPVPAFGSILVVLWLLFFRSAPSTFPSWAGYPSRSLFPGVPSRKIILEIGQIHLSIEAQCGTPVYLWVTATPKAWGIKAVTQMSWKQYNLVYGFSTGKI